MGEDGKEEGGGEDGDVEADDADVTAVKGGRVLSLQHFFHARVLPLSRSGEGRGRRRRLLLLGGACLLRCACLLRRETEFGDDGGGHSG